MEEGGAGDGGEEVVTEVQHHQVRQACEGGAVDAGDVGPGEVQSLQVSQVRAGEHQPVQLGQPAPRHVQHLHKTVQLTSYEQVQLCLLS